MIDMWVCTILTVAAIIMNLATCCRAGYYALRVEYKPWSCRRSHKQCGLRILMGFVVVTLLLSLLKSWAVEDVFLKLWSEYPEKSHIRAYLFLVENIAVPMLGWKVTSFIITVSGCDREVDYGIFKNV